MALLPSKCRKYLLDRSICFDEIEEGGRRAVILRGMALPPGRFDAAKADILILLPPGYPDGPPDMFYALPWLRLVPANCYPNAANHAFAFGGQSWQRWSRHNDAWRPGIDGIWTMLKRVEAALAVAA